MAENSATFYDRQEVRSPADREAALFHALPGLLHHALANAPFFAVETTLLSTVTCAENVESPCSRSCRSPIAECT